MNDAVTLSVMYKIKYILHKKLSVLSQSQSPTLALAINILLTKSPQKKNYLDIFAFGTTITFSHVSVRSFATFMVSFPVRMLNFKSQCFDI